MAKVNIVLDASMLDMFQLCPCRFDYRYNQTKVTPVKQRQLDRGTVVHYGLELYYKALREGKHYNDAVNEALNKCRELAVIASDLEVEDIGRIIEVMEEYFDFWRIEDQNLIIKEVESSFLYELYSDDAIRITMSGKIDLLVNDLRYTNLPIDHKSYDRSYESRRFSNQFLNYAYAADSNVLLVNKIGFQKSLKPEEKYKRVPLSYDPLIKEQWKKNVVQVVYQQYLPCVAENSWPMNLTSCDKFNRLCEYYEVCDASGDEAKFYKLNANFVNGEIWDVSKVLSRAYEEK